MTELEAKYILDKHTALFNLALNNNSIPDRSHMAIVEIHEAYKVFNPTYHLDSCCSSCVWDLIKVANNKRLELSLKYHSFPKQD